MHLSPMMTIPYIPSNTPPTRPPNSKPRQKQEPPSPTPAPRLVPGERRVKPRLSKSSLDPVLESDQRLSRDVEQIVSADVSKVTRKHSLPILARRRTDTPDETVSLRQTDEVGDRVRRTSVVVADIKTNVIIEDEYTFITELSEYLSIRYNRPASCIVTTLQHGICIQFGGSCDPSYTMKIEAVARDMQTATNKRNIALFQRHMEQALGIPASRGYLRFVPVAEDCAGWKGNTIAGEIADAKDRTHVVSERWGSIRAPRRKSSKAFRELRSKTTTSTETATLEQSSPTRVSEDGLAANKQTIQGDTKAGKDKTKVVKRRKSFIQALFPRSSSRPADREIEGGSRAMQS